MRFPRLGTSGYESEPLELPFGQIDNGAGSVKVWLAEVDVARRLCRFSLAA